MKCSTCFSLLILFPLLISLPAVSSRHISSHGGHRHHSQHRKPVEQKLYRLERKTGPSERGPDTVEVAGSRLPDCAHACGSCSPCRLVMISFVCASLEEAETCPMAYRCMCNNKSYPVP